MVRLSSDSSWQCHPDQNPLEGCSRLSVECTPPSLVSITSSPSPLSAKLCSMCVHRSVQDLKNLQHNQLASAHTIHRRQRSEGCSRMSVAYTPPSLESISSSPSPVSGNHCSMCVHRSVQELEVYRIFRRPVPIPEARGIFGRAVVGCPSNPHLKVWCLSAPLHHLCLLNFVPCASIDLIKI